MTRRSKRDQFIKYYYKYILYLIINRWNFKLVTELEFITLLQFKTIKTGLYLYIVVVCVNNILLKSCPLTLY